MGHKVSTPTDSAPLHNNYHDSSSSCSAEGPHRKVALSLLAMCLTASTASGFALPSPNHPPLAQVSTSRRRSSTTTRHFLSSTAASLSDFSPPAAETAANPLAGLGDLLQRRHRKNQRRSRVQIDYERRKQEWADKYTSVEALRETFGANKNKVWGDLDAGTTRRLYKTLLPRALLELYKVGVHPEDLAPLAYKARLAAKLYARERGVVPSRLFAMGYDGFRQWKRYGKFQPTGMSYDQVYQKYKNLIQEEEENSEDLKESDVTAKICLKILERSCQTNEHMDKLFLRDGYDYAAAREERQDIATLTEQLEKDVRSILVEADGKAQSSKSLTAQQVFTLRMVARAKRRMEKFQKTQKHHHQQEKTLAEELEDARPWNARKSKTGDRRKLWQDRTPPPRRSH